MRNRGIFLFTGIPTAPLLCNRQTLYSCHLYRAGFGYGSYARAWCYIYDGRTLELSDTFETYQENEAVFPENTCRMKDESTLLISFKSTGKVFEIKNESFKKSLDDAAFTELSSIQRITTDKDIVIVEGMFRPNTVLNPFGRFRTECHMTADGLVNKSIEL